MAKKDYSSVNEQVGPAADESRTISWERLIESGYRIGFAADEHRRTILETNFGAGG